MNKRGLSNTVSVMLLIVIAIAALVLIWFYLRTEIVDLSKQIKTECVILHLEPNDCLINADNSLSITLKRNPGSEKIQLKTAKLLFTFTDDSSIIKEVTNLPQTIAPIITLQPIPAAEIPKPIKSIRTSAVIEYEDKTGVCALSASEIKCSTEKVLDDGSPTLPGTNCGNNVVEAGEQCDDGNLINTDACTNACTLTTCGDGIVQNPNGNSVNEICDDGAANGLPGNCNLLCTGIIPLCGPTPSWVYLNTWFYDNFVDPVLHPFWPADVRNNWILDSTAVDGSDTGILISNRDLDSRVVTINGKFDFDIGYTYRNDLTSIGFFVNETFGPTPLRHLYMKASPNNAGTEYRIRARNFNDNDLNTTRRFLSPINRTDTRLIRNFNNNFTWLYKQDTAPYTSWSKLHNVTGNPAYNLNTNMTLLFDEGSVNNLRYVKLQADEGLPCIK